MVWTEKQKRFTIYVVRSMMSSGFSKAILNFDTAERSSFRACELEAWDRVADSTCWRRAGTSFAMAGVAVKHFNSRRADIYS